MADTARVHRYVETGAVCINGSETQYLHPKTLRALGKTLIALSDDINNREFTRSRFRTVRICTQGNNITITEGES